MAKSTCRGYVRKYASYLHPSLNNRIANARMKRIRQLHNCANCRNRWSHDECFEQKHICIFFEEGKTHFDEDECRAIYEKQ